MAMPSSAPLPAPHMVARMLLVAGALQQARAQQVAAPARSPPGRSAKGNKGTVFQPVDGGMNRVCRGANFTDDPESDYMLHLGVATLGDCMRLCIEAPVCKGVEYNPNHHGGRCEVWTRAGGINATAPVPGFTCLRYGAVTERFDLLGGGANRACRGSSPEDNSEAYYTLHKGTASLAACKELCIRSSGCKGVEYNEQLDGGRCEVWTRVGGIKASRPMAGVTCLQYGVTLDDPGAMDAHEASDTKVDITGVVNITLGQAEAAQKHEGQPNLVEVRTSRRGSLAALSPSL
mmetsp:Transcript_64541/g.194735  ORF Transcript_64541/g.194735 Transcript_64541/m.194735 type:complete len:290 (+) Transcript_64541:54-923(+)